MSWFVAFAWYFLLFGTCLVGSGAIGYATSLDDPIKTIALSGVLAGALSSLLVSILYRRQWVSGLEFFSLSLWSSGSMLSGSWLRNQSQFLANLGDSFLPLLGELFFFAMATMFVHLLFRREPSTTWDQGTS